MSTITVKDSANNDVSVNVLPPVGPVAKANSLPVTMATDDPIVLSTANVVTTTANTAAQTANVVVHTSNTAAQIALAAAVRGAVADAPYANTTGATSGTVVSLLKGAYVALSSVVARLPVLGTQPANTSMSVTPAQEQDPIYDHAAGVKITANTTSQILLTPSANTRFVRVSCDVDVFLNTANVTAVDNGTAIHVIANSPEIIPVTPSLGIKGISANTASVVRLTPMKTRP